MPNILKSMVVVLLLLGSDFEMEGNKSIPSAATSLDKTRAGMFDDLLFVRATEKPS